MFDVFLSFPSSFGGVGGLARHLNLNSRLLGHAISDGVPWEIPHKRFGTFSFLSGLEGVLSSKTRTAEAHNYFL